MWNERESKRVSVDKFKEKEEKKQFYLKQKQK